MRCLPWLVVASTALAAVAACGGRSYEVALVEVAGAAGGGSPGAGGAGGSTSSTASTSGTTSGEGGNGGSSTGEGGASSSSSGTGQGGGGINPIDCIGCIAQDCPDVLACIQDPACGQGLLCTVSQCLGGGQPDLMCVLGCFDGDFGAATQAVQALGCVIGTCGDACGGAFPGFPGGG